MFLLEENNRQRQLWTLVLSKIYASTLYCGATLLGLTISNAEMHSKRSLMKRPANIWDCCWISALMLVSVVTSLCQADNGYRQLLSSTAVFAHTAVDQMEIDTNQTVLWSPSSSDSHILQAEMATSALTENDEKKGKPRQKCSATRQAERAPALPSSAGRWSHDTYMPVGYYCFVSQPAPRGPPRLV